MEIEIPEGFKPLATTNHYGHGKDASVVITPTIYYNDEILWEGESRVAMRYDHYPFDPETVEQKAQLEAEDRLLNRLRRLFAD